MKNHIYTISKLLLCLLLAPALLSGASKEKLDRSLIDAASAGDVEKTETGLPAGAAAHANPDLPARNGWIALMYAAAKGWPDIVQLLVEAKAGLNFREQGGHTALMIAVMNDQAAAVKALIDAGADLGIKAGDGKTALA